MPLFIASLTNPEWGSVWMNVFQLSEGDVKSYSHVCSRPFADGHVRKEPQVNLGKQFASPMKKEHPRNKRAKRRCEDKELSELRSKSESRSRSVTPALSAQVASQSVTPQASVTSGQSPMKKDTAVLVNAALVARIEALEAENHSLKEKAIPSVSPFRIEQIKNDDRLVRFYTHI